MGIMNGEYLTEEENKLFCKFSDALVRSALGDDFVNTHTKEEIGRAYMECIADVDVTFLYKRPYPVVQRG